jgi:hypothetical protein
LQVFFCLWAVAVGAGGILTSFTDGLSSLSVYPSAGTTSMHQARDYIHPYKDAGGCSSHCRTRIYLPNDVRDAPVVICSELPNNPGGSITNSAETIAAGVIRANELPTPLVWIEHWPEENLEGQETFELVDFSSYRLERGRPT